jgi:hypothetical protein
MMDPITASLVAALAAGVAGGVTQVGSQLIVDAYTELKNALKEKFGVESKVGQAVDTLVEEPDFEPNQQALAGRLKQENADKDAELMALAKQLAEALETTAAGKEAVKKYQVNAQNIGVVGDNAHIEGGIKFGK